MAAFRHELKLASGPSSQIWLYTLDVIGLALTIYFSSQGAAKVIGPVLAQTARLIYIAAVGWWLSTHDATAQNFFWLAASSMVVLGLLSCSSVVLTRWGPRESKAAIRRALSAAAD
ncbi:hypothetical protein ACVWWG_002450 [Bradyrhizobium sp. LB7.2]